MSSKWDPNRTNINITSQTAVSFFIRMFSDRFASLCHLSVLRKKCKSLVRVIKFEGVASSPRALNCERNLKRSEQTNNQTVQKHRRRNRPKRYSFRHLLPERLRSRYRTQKKRSQGSPGVSPEGPRATVERPREVPGAPPERPRSAQIIPEASKVRPRCLRGALWTPFWLHLDFKMEVWEPIWPQKGAQIPTPRPPPRFQHPVLHRGGPCERREIEKGSAGIAKRADARAQTHGGTRHYTSAQGRFPFLPLLVYMYVCM